MVRAAVLFLGLGLVVIVGLADAAAASARSCASLARTDTDLSEGPASAYDRAINMPSTGTLRAAVIFVDFPDAPASASPSELVEQWIEPGARWLDTTSYGRLAVVLQPMSGWVRMPRPAGSYGMTGDYSYETHQAYIADAIAAADPTFDFSQTDIVYVVAQTDKVAGAATFRGTPGTFVADGRSLGAGVTFTEEDYEDGRTILPHETGHVLGLPDLYAFSGSQHRYVGVWDLMGNVYQPTDMFAWHRLKLGWLDAAQVVCAPRRRSTRVALTPLGEAGGRKAVFVRMASTRGLLVENRQRVGNDGSICDRGALVYTVDSSVDVGLGPIRVRGSAGDCGFGLGSKAPLHAGQSLTVGGVRVAVVRSRRSVVTVRVTVP